MKCRICEQLYTVLNQILKHEILNLFVNNRKRRREQKKMSPVMPPRKHKKTIQKHVAIDKPITSSLEEESAIEAQKTDTVQRPSVVQKKASVATKRRPDAIQKTKREVERRDGKLKKSDKPLRPNSVQKRAALMKITRSAGGHCEEGSIATGQTQERQKKSLRPNSIMKMAALIKGKKKPSPKENETASNKIAVVRPVDIYAQVDKKKKKRKKTDCELPELETDRSNQYKNLNKNINSSDKNEKAENLEERKADETLMYENEDLYNIEGSNDEHSSNNTCQKDSGKISECKKEGNITSRNHTETIDSLDPNIYENVTPGTANSESKNELQQHDPNLYANIESKKDEENGEYEEDGTVENSMQSISLPDNCSNPPYRRTSIV